MHSYHRIMKQEDTSGIHLWLVLMKAHRTLLRYAEGSIEATGLCFSDFAVLEALLHKGPMPINTIGEKVPLTSGSLTAAVDRLEKRGLVGRRLDPEDRRIRRAYLTEAGTAFTQKIFDQHRQDMEKSVADLSLTEKQTLLRLLKKLGTTAQAQLGIQ